MGARKRATIVQRLTEQFDIYESPYPDGTSAAVATEIVETR
jgi:hypothetical protein